MEYELRKPLKA